jgi:ABC-type phosphate transport system substrate-binding protein
LRIIGKVLSGVTAAVAIAALAATPAMADPPSGTTPKAADVVGVGSDTIQGVMDQFSHDFNATVSSSATHLYSWDATNPKTAAIHDNIITKKGCKAIPRPDGSGEGILALTTENAKTSGHPCMDFARSSRDRAPTDPGFKSGGIAFATLAGDAVAFATQPGTHAPASLNTAQLAAIYTCKVTNWNQVGGKAGKIAAFIPQSGSGTRSFFLTAIGVTTPGSCVKDGGGKLEENEGVNSVLNTNKANVIFPFSVGKYIAERYHSAKCFNTKCTPASSGANKGLACKPGKGQNLFGCDTHGTMSLNKVNNTNPTTPFPLTNTSKNVVINTKFTATFQRLLFEVVPFSTASGNVRHIASNLAKFFGPKGYVCSNKTAITDLKNYGFRVLPTATTNKAGTCGSTH